jgi:hypothetical protein
MAWPKGKSRKTDPAAVKAIRPKKVMRSVSDLVVMMNEYQSMSDGRLRGLFEDCKTDIYRMFLLDHNDRRAIADLRPSGCSDRVFHEWEIRFERAFGKIAA